MGSHHLILILFWKKRGVVYSCLGGADSCLADRLYFDVCVSLEELG